MTVDVSKLQFYSNYPIDKIVYQNPSPVTYSVPGPATPGGGNDRTTIFTITNPYGKKAYTTLSYSLDGSNFYDQSVQLSYFNSGLTQQLLRMGVTMACSNTTISFIFLSNYTATQNVTINYTLDTIS